MPLNLSTWESEVGRSLITRLVRFREQVSGPPEKPCLKNLMMMMIMTMMTPPTTAATTTKVSRGQKGKHRLRVARGLVTPT